MLWISGRPAAGKSCFARELHRRLSTVRQGEGTECCVLDGDEVRRALHPNPGYSDQDRDNFYRTLAALAGLLARQGLTVLVPATAARLKYREYARAECEASSGRARYLEVFVDTPLELARARDDKKLYAKHAEGKVRNLPGVDMPFEAPAAPDVVAKGGLDEAALTAVLSLVQRSA